MKVCILMGSPRLQGNTATVLKPFMDRLEEKGAAVDYITLSDKHIEPCIDCRLCQDVYDAFGCPLKDDLQPIFDAVLQADCIIWATPIYSWNCTPPMKAVLDRLVRGMNKYYGQKKGSSLWEGKKCAIVTTCGYNIEYAAGPFEESLRRYCKHSRLTYIDKMGMRDTGSIANMQKEEVVSAAWNFADTIYDACI